LADCSRWGALMQGKQAKIVSPIQERAILGYLATTRYPARDRVMFLLSMKAGLRAKEMASLTWAMVTDAQGQVAEVLHVPNRASKGKTGGRTIPLHLDLQAALVALQTVREDMSPPERPILFSERGGRQGDRILIPCNDVDRPLERDLIIDSRVVDQCHTLLLLLEI